MGDRRSKDDKMSIPLWKKPGGRKRYRVEEKAREENKKCGKS